MFFFLAQNALLQFVRVVKAKQQMVSGIMHYLTIEVIDGGKKELYEAKVWVKAWLNFKELQEFTRVGDSSTVVAPADQGNVGFYYAPLFSFRRKFVRIGQRSKLLLVWLYRSSN